MEEVEQRREFAKSKQKKLKDRQITRKTRREKAELTKAYKELMRLGPDLIGKKPRLLIPVVSVPKLARKTKSKTASTQLGRKKKTVTICQVQFGAGVQRKNQVETNVSRVSSRGRIIYNTRKL